MVWIWTEQQSTRPTFATILVILFWGWGGGGWGGKGCSLCLNRGCWEFPRFEYMYCNYSKIFKQTCRSSKRSSLIRGYTVLSDHKQTNKPFPSNCQILMPQMLSVLKLFTRNEGVDISFIRGGRKISKNVPVWFFCCSSFLIVRLWFRIWHLCCPYLFLSFGASGGLCFMFVAFPGYFHFD